MREAAKVQDCIIVGGGPAGLTAAIYLARFHLSVTVFDDHQSRASRIPLTRNHAGFPKGIAGEDLMRRMRRQAMKFGARLVPEQVESLRREGLRFHLQTSTGAYQAAKVLIASGVVNLRPVMPEDLHAQALSRGLIRYCPVCDGYEVTGRRIAALGTGAHALREACFLRSYSSDVTLISPHGPHRLSADELRCVDEWNIRTRDGPVTDIQPESHGISLRIDGRLDDFDTLYVALGTKPRAELAITAGAATAAEGCIMVNRHQMTSVEGLYAAGDVVEGLDQISVAMGQAAIAATAMRNAISAEHRLIYAAT